MIRMSEETNNTKKESMVAAQSQVSFHEGEKDEKKTVTIHLPAKKTFFGGAILKILQILGIKDIFRGIGLVNRDLNTAVNTPQVWNQILGQRFQGTNINPDKEKYVVCNLIIKNFNDLFQIEVANLKKRMLEAKETKPEAEKIPEKMESKEFVDFVAKRKNLGYEFPINLENYSPEDQGRILDGILKNPAAFAAVINDLEALLRFLFQFPGVHAERAIKCVLENDGDFSRIINSKNFYDFLELFPQHKEQIINRLFQNEQVFNTVITSQDNLSYFSVKFPEYKDALAKNILASNVKFTKFFHYGESGWELDKFAKIFPQYASQAKEKLYSRSFQEYLETRYLSKTSYLSAILDADKDIVMSISIKYVHDGQFTNDLIVMIKDNEHYDRNALYDVLYNFITKPSHYSHSPERMIQKKENGMLIISNPHRELLNYIEGVMPNYCPSLRLTNRKMFSETILSIQEWERNLREKFSDPDLRLVRVPGENGGSVRLLIVDPVAAQKVTTALAANFQSCIVDKNQIDVPFSDLEKFKKALSKVSRVARESKDTDSPVSYLEKIQKMAATHNISLNIKAIPGGKEKGSYALIEFSNKEEASYFARVMKVDGLTLLSENKSSIPLEALSSIKDSLPAVRTLKIQKMITELCNWTANKDPITSIVESRNSDNEVEFNITREIDGSPVEFRCPEDVFNGLHATYKAKQEAATASQSNHSSSSSGSATNGSSYGQGSSRFLPAPSTRETTEVPASLPMGGRSPSDDNEERKFPAPTAPDLS